MNCKNCGEAIQGVGPHMDGTFDWYSHQNTGMTHCVFDNEISDWYAEPTNG